MDISEAYWPNVLVFSQKWEEKCLRLAWDRPNGMLVPPCLPRTHDRHVLHDFYFLGSGGFGSVAKVALSYHVQC